ncbi:hypothetical protein [Nocardioides sp.]|jgi:hypothetical protein|uniref:hypothetical protein n=1 Tax=Nocardioides sp. TaxID=35761 RepID=UPI00260CE959|nr:hypothetical protein [Nocardioides sp.]
MRFSEHELTAALHGAAKSVLGAQRRVRRGQDVDEVWESMDRLERFRLLDGLGGQVLPVLVALPDVEVAVGTRPSYDDEVIAEVVAGLLGDGVGGRLKRAVVVKGRTALVQIALASVPPRRDPDALLHNDDDLPEVPDSPEGL